jgi:hypothetical protein
MLSEEPVGNLLDMSYEEFAKVYANVFFLSSVLTFLI